MGTVYKARDTRLQRLVAIKVLSLKHDEEKEGETSNPDASGDAGSTPSPTPENPPAPNPNDQTEGVAGKTSKK